MRNSLAIILDRKNVGRRELAALTGYSYKTVSAYETTDRPLSKDFLEKAAVALGVSIEEIEQPPPAELREDATPYTTGSIPMEILSDQRLLQLKADFAHQLPEAAGRQFGMLMQALASIGAEIDRRRLKPKAPPSSNLTSDEEFLAKAAIDHADIERERERAEREGKPQLPAAAAPGGSKHGKSAPSSQPSRAERPAAGGKAQK